MSVRHVFVYGTLRQGEARDINRLLPAPRRLGTARVAGVLYHLGEYPGLLLGAAGSTGSVQGEVYEISAELERLLDEIEEVLPLQSGEYCKREQLVRVDETGDDVLCIVYEIAADRLSGMRIMADGDWVLHRLDREFHNS